MSNESSFMYFLLFLRIFHAVASFIEYSANRRNANAVCKDPKNSSESQATLGNTYNSSESEKSLRNLMTSLQVAETLPEPQKPWRNLKNSFGVSRISSYFHWNPKNPF